MKMYWHYLCWQSHGCVIVENVIYAHRSQSSVLVQEVVVVNHGVCRQIFCLILKIIPFSHQYKGLHTDFSIFWDQQHTFSGFLILFISIFKEDGTILACCQWRKLLFISHEQQTKINLKPYFIGIVDRNKLSKHDMSTFNQHSGIKVLLTHEGAKAWKGSTTKSLR